MDALRPSAARDGVTQAEQALAKVRTEREAAFREWLAGKPTVPVMLLDMTGRFDFEAFIGTNKAALQNLAPGATDKDNGERSDEVPLVAGKVGKAAQLDGENNVNFPTLGRFTRHTPFTIAFWMRDPRIAAALVPGCDGNANVSVGVGVAVPGPWGGAVMVGTSVPVGPHYGPYGPMW